jgi:VanZ family protein
MTQLTQIFFSLLSICYIAAIFILAGSPIVRSLSLFNPYSLLHIPFYGILTLLLIFSFMPFKFNSRNSRNSRNHLFVAALFALIVAIADEIHQAYVPGRDASLTDVLLDMAGIGIVIFFTSQLFRKKESPKTRLTL